jgi:hypothetical protein
VVGVVVGGVVGAGVVEVDVTVVPGDVPGAAVHPNNANMAIHTVKASSILKASVSLFFIFVSFSRTEAWD